MKVNIEVEIPTEMLVWQRPDKAKAACPSTGRLPVLFARGKWVSTGVYLSSLDEFWWGDEETGEKLKPETVDWWANLPVPPGQTEAGPT